MPSKKKNRGSPLVALRIPADLLATIDAQIESCNRTRREEPYNRSSFILAALRERFDKYARAKAAGQKKRGGKLVEQPGPVAVVEQPGPVAADQEQPVVGQHSHNSNDAAGPKSADLGRSGSELAIDELPALD